MKIILILIILFYSSLASAATYYVRAGGTGSGCTSSGADACPTITLGLTKLTASGDILDIGPGTFYGRYSVPRAGVIIRGVGTSTIADGSSDASGGWTLATNTDRSGYSGNGADIRIWKKESLPSGLCTMTVNGESLWQINPGFSAKADEKMLAGANSTWDGSPYYTAVEHWGGVEGTWWTDPSTPTKYYLRFRNGDDPNGKVIRVAPGGSGCGGNTANPVFDVNSFNNVTISNMTIQGANIGIQVRGSSSGTIIENNTIKDGVHRILLSSPSNGTIVRNNIIFSNAYGYGQAAAVKTYLPWEGGGPTGNVTRRASFNFYQFAKYYRNGDGTEYDNGVSNHGATGSEIYSNTFTLGQEGIRVWAENGQGPIIYSNTFNGWQEAIMWEYANSGSAGNINIQIYNNTFTNNNYCVRVQDWGQHSRTDGKFFGNKCWNSTGAGSWFYFNTETGGSFLAKMYIYHNTFIGGFSSTGQAAGGFGSWGSTLGNVVFLNNIMQADTISGQIYAYGRGCLSTESWSRNWTYGVAPSCSFVVNPNPSGGSPMFTGIASSPPSNWTPSGSAVNGGIDITVPFTIGTLPTYSALPFVPDYSDSTPDIGAIPSVALGPVVTITAPVSTPTYITSTQIITIGGTASGSGF